MTNKKSITFQWAPRFERAFKKLPREVRLLFSDKMTQFEENWQHPSFKAKRIQGTDNIWEASLNMSIRFTFEWIEDENGEHVCLLRFLFMPIAAYEKREAELRNYSPSLFLQHF